MGNLFQTVVQVQHLSWRRLVYRQSSSPGRSETHLCIFQALEERRNTNKTDIIVPHNSILLLIPRKSENILKNFTTSAMTKRNQTESKLATNLQNSRDQSCAENSSSHCCKECGEHTLAYSHCLARWRTSESIEEIPDHSRWPRRVDSSPYP